MGEQFFAVRKLFAISRENQGTATGDAADRFITLCFESLMEATQNNFDFITVAFRKTFIIPAANQLQHQIAALQCKQKPTKLVEEFVTETKFK